MLAFGALLLCGFCGSIGASQLIKAQQPVVLETVSDGLSTSAAATPSPAANLDIQAKAAVLMDADTGTVIYQQDGHKELPPASVTKIMTMLLAMEAEDSGKVKLTDQVTISERAASMGGSQMYMEPGEVHTLEELMQGIAMVSANDACVAVSEYIAGSEEVFVEKMNQRAEKLGMRDTHFVNTNGLPVADHYTSAYDIALMSKALLQHEETKPWFTTWQATIKVGLPGKEKEFGLTNTNKLLKQFPGACGIKTGFTQEAGYCLSAAAERDGTTLIAVVLGAETSKSRTAEISKLLNYGFASYASVTLAEKGEKIKEVQIDKGDPYRFYAVTAEKATAFVKKGEEKSVKKKIILEKNLKLPLKKGGKVGRMDIYSGKEKIGTCILVSDRAIGKADFFTYYIRKIKNLF
ncbi:MAG: D-alanyl-D-alanine carboxypeptidase [Firmicutes bacterium]|nr:D-alanyl-D-alanine carboxypeptidase [Bacillota bacterium]